MTSVSGGNSEQQQQGSVYDPDNEHDRMRFAAALRALRNMHRLGQRDLAQRVGVAATMIRRLEGGTAPTWPKYVVPVCKATGVSKAELEALEELIDRARARLGEPPIEGLATGGR